MKVKLVALSLTFAALAHSAEPEVPAPLDAKALTALANKHKKLITRRTDFESPQEHASRFAFLQQPFVVEVPLAVLGESSRDWTYDADRRVLQVTMKSLSSIHSVHFFDYARRVDELKARPYELPRYFALVPLWESSTKRGSYVGSTAFGVRAKVQSTSWSAIGLTFLNIGDSELKDPAHLDLEVDPGQAKSLTQALAWRFSGTTMGVVEPKPSSYPEWLANVPSYSEATLSSPHVMSSTTYVIPATLARFELVDRRDGRVLRTWQVTQPSTTTK